jgi:APA family basic amino acid/polyamine antiporter
MIGSGIFLLPSSLARYGAISLVGWLVSACGALLIALVFAGLARRVAGSGGPYVYTRAAFGNLPGFLIGWGYWISMIAGNAAIAIALVGYLSVFAPALGEQPMLATATALGVIWLLVLVNCLGLREAGRVQLATTVLKLIPLLAIGAVGPWFIEPAHFEPWNRSGGSGFAAITATAALTFWAFMGMECANIPAEDVADAQRTVPRAAIGGTLLAALVYIPGTVAVLGLLEPALLAQSPAPYADAARVLWGDAGYYVIGAGAAIACFGALNGWTLCLGQIPMAAARDGLFPGSFGRITRFGTPALGICLSSLIVTALILMNYSQGLVDQFTFVVLLATLAALLPYLVCALARIVLSFRDRDAPSAGALDIAVAAGGALFAGWAIVGTGAGAVLWGTALLLAGMPVYVWLRSRRRGATEAGAG